MAMIESDILRKCVREEIDGLEDGELEKVLGYIRSLSKGGEERDVPERLVDWAVRYTLGEIKEGGRFCSTKEVFDKLDKKFGWR